MKILILTGIFEPESGGPATYTPRLATKLVEAGHQVKVVTYSDNEITKEYNFDLEVVRRQGKFKNLANMYKKIKELEKDYDITYSLDWFTVGLPLALSSTKGYVLRVGGGYIWEKYLRDKKEPMTLKDFCQEKKYMQYPLMYTLLNYIFRNAKHIVFNSKIQREIYIEHYKVKESNSSVIFNPLPKDIDVQRDNPSDEIVFAGRMIEMKNIKNMILGYIESEIDSPLTIIGDGPQKEEIKSFVEEKKLTDRIKFENSLPQKELFERIRNVKYVIVPSWTDICPNQVFECLSAKIPFLVTKENYLPIKEQIPLNIDPKSPSDIAKKMKMLDKEDCYNQYISDLEKINYEHNWDDVTNMHLNLFNRILNKDGKELF